MGMERLGVAEKKVLGALICLSDDEMHVEANMQQIADKMGYAKVGGTITYALKVLEMHNYINRTGKASYQVLL